MSASLGLIADRLGLAPQWRPRVSLALALITWLILHVIAIETASPVDSGASDASLSLAMDLQGQFVHLVTQYLQYLMPLGLCTGAALALLKRWRARGKVAVAPTRPALAVGSMSWRDFEQLLVAAFRGHGFAIGAFGAAAADGSVNYLLVKGSARWLVHCKHWRAWQVGKSAVEELQGEITLRHASGGYLVSGGWFTQEARALAADLRVTLLDGDSLGKYLAEVGVDRSSRPARALGSTQSTAAFQQSPQR
jgi:restriction system protein